MTTIADVQNAMIRGIEAAGFVNVREQEPKDHQYGRFVIVGVKGDCPCGLGTSRFAEAINRDSISLLRLTDCRTIEERFKAMGLGHIEHDKAEGRWK